MSEDKSLINIGNISLINIDLSNASKVAMDLIKKISNAISSFYKPYQLVRDAKAESQVEIIEANTQITITDLQRRAMLRFFSEEAQKQDNIEKITFKALPELEDNANPQNVENDWITNFFDKCRIVSDGEMQSLWAKVLAGEANTPGTYSKRTVNFLDSIDKTDAQHFTDICGFMFVFEKGESQPIIYNNKVDMITYYDPIYQNKGINHSTLHHLCDIGLIRFNPLGFLKYELPKQITITYHGTSINLELIKKMDNRIPVGSVLLTEIGQQLAPICEAKSVDGFVDYVIERLFKEGSIRSRSG